MGPEPLLECVPNFSEGRDRSKIEAIEEAIRSAGAAILDRHMDADHNRSVVTFAGPATSVAEAAFRSVRQAMELIDLRRHTGAHPRIGAADVVPFVPLRGAALGDCVPIAEKVGQRIWDELRIPVYLYGAAARRPERANLAAIRRGQFEGLREQAPALPEHASDIGGPKLHVSAGATAVGARRFLIAFNINLTTTDLEIARSVARAIRFSSGGLPCVQAMGVMLRSRNLAQVSMNLTDFERTPIERVFEAVRAEAARRGSGIAGSEIIGLIPRKALDGASPADLLVEGFHEGMVLENRLEQEAAAGRLVGWN
jgi:glutamate formiminotransferase